MTVRRIVLWIAANVAFVLAVGAGLVAWLLFAGTSSRFTGPNASASGGLVAVGRGVPLLLLGALVAFNVAWFAFVVRKQ